MTEEEMKFAMAFKNIKGEEKHFPSDEELAVMTDEEYEVAIEPYVDLAIEMDRQEIIWGFCKCIWEVYKNQTGLDMADETHREGEPWFLLNELHKGDLSNKPQIRDSAILKVFTDKLKYFDSMKEEKYNDE